MARKKSPYAVFSFRTTTDALRMEKAAREAGLPGRLIPLPRQISAGCGLAWSAPPGGRASLEKLAADRDIGLEGIHEIDLYDYRKR